MKLYYVANARFPNEKAHGIQIAKMCEAFIEEGVDLELVVPRRVQSTKSVQDFYGLSVPVPVMRIPVLDCYVLGPLGYLLSSVPFMIGSLLYLWMRRIRGEQFVVYTVDIDTFASALLPFVGKPCFAEMHGEKVVNGRNSFFINRLTGAIAINGRIKKEVVERFKLPAERILVEPNGWSPEHLVGMTKKSARLQLGLPLERFLVVYTGLFSPWKGLEIFPPVAQRLGERVEFYLAGGTAEDLSQAIGEKNIPTTIHCVGLRPPKEVALWQMAGDVVVVTGSKKHHYSYYYTSPMKLFESMGAQQLVIAADTPAIAEYVSDQEVVLYATDDPASLAGRIEVVYKDPARFTDVVARAYTKALQHSWRARAQRILDLMYANNHGKAR